MGKKYCVYVHTNKKDGKRYVGITSQRPEDRWANGKGYKENRHFDSAIKKYGWNNFEHEIPLRGLTRELACQWECALIAQYDSTDPAKGYNIALGGVGQNSVSTVTRKKMSDQTTRFFENHPEAREHLAELGRRQFSTYESKQAVSERMKKMFAEHPEKKATKAIRQYNLNGNYLRDWESAVLAEKDGGYDRKKISSCLTGHQKSACGYLWRYASKSGPTKIEGIPQKQKKPEKQRKCKRYIGVEQYDRKGNWIRSFDSVLEATQVAGVNHSCIIRCCRGRGHTAGGYQWRYSVDKAIQLCKQSKWQRFRVAQYSMDGQLVEIYESVIDAEKALGLNHPSKISYVCNGQRKSCNGYIWKYIDGSVQGTVDPYRNMREKEVYQCDKSGNIVNVYKSMADAENKSGIKRNNIYRVCRGERKTAGGYIWRYSDELQNKTI